MTKTPSEAFCDADRKWHNELVAEFGKRAGDVRYTEKGRGRPFSALRLAWAERDAARTAWEQAVLEARAPAPITSEPGFDGRKS